MNTTERTVIQALVDQTKRESFTNGYEASDAEAFGLIMARYFEHDSRILLASARALEDANFHAIAGEVEAMHKMIMAADDDELIDSSTRSALFAALGERFPNVTKNRALRLRKLTVLAGRESDPITSLSDRYCNMTMGDARRVFRVLDELA